MQSALVIRAIADTLDGTVLTFALMSNKLGTRVYPSATFDESQVEMFC